MDVRNAALRAFYRCNQYEAAIGLLENLKAFGFTNTNLDDMFETLLLSITTEFRDEARSRDILILFLATDDICSAFKKVNHEDKSCVYDFFKRLFQIASERNFDINLRGTYDSYFSYKELYQQDK